MSRGHWVWMVCGLAGLLLATGCDKLKDMAGGKGADSAGGDTTAAPGGGGDPDAELGLKVNEYIVCINKASSHALKSRSRYLGWVDAKTGPTGKEKVIYGLFKIHNVDMCKKALKKAKTMKPDTPDLAKAAEAYEKALDELLPLVNKAHDYYSQKTYKDDDMKQGKEMHAPLMAAFDKFNEGDKGLRNRIASINDKMAQRDLERIAKKDGKKLLYHWKVAMMKGKALVRAGDVPDLPDLDLDKYSTALTEFETAVKGVDDYATKNAAETKKVMMFSSALGNAKDFLKSAKEMMKRKQDKKEWTQGEVMQINRNNAWMVDGHPAQFVKAYNELVNSSNTLRW